MLTIRWLNHFVGQTDTLLSDEGIEQARLAGNKLNDEKFSHIFSSDLKRARKVCQTRFFPLLSVEAELMLDSREDRE